MLLSVVIPFYNVERYIAPCLERAARLPVDECELLLVDDCGQDGSLEIARAFCDVHENARLLRRAHNGGLSVARNTGLREARGEYVYFLDSDDLPEPDALMRLARRARDEALDVAKARYRLLDDDTGETRDGPAFPATQAADGASLFAAQCRAGLYEPMVWQCVYRLAFLRERELEMPKGLLFEDELFQTPALLFAARAAASEDAVLLYRTRAGSIMTSFARDSRWCRDYLTVCRRLSSLADSLPDSPARAALRKRVGQIALSVAKNIPAYGLTGRVKREAESFLFENKRELVDFARESGDPAVAIEGAMLAMSPRAFMRAYARIKNQ